LIRRVTPAGVSIFSGVRFPAAPGADPADAIRRYLAARRTESAKALAAKAAILIDPQNRAGEIVARRVGRRANALSAAIGARM
jgi:hypothetical protein